MRIWDTRLAACSIWAVIPPLRSSAPCSSLSIRRILPLLLSTFPRSTAIWPSNCWCIPSSMLTFTRIFSSSSSLLRKFPPNSSERLYSLSRSSWACCSTKEAEAKSSSAFFASADSFSNLSSQTATSTPCSSSLNSRYFFAFSDWTFKGSNCSSSSDTLSPMRIRLSSVCSSFRSVSSFRCRYLEIPAASSKISRRSALFRDRISSILPCPILE